MRRSRRNPVPFEMFTEEMATDIVEMNLPKSVKKGGVTLLGPGKGRGELEGHWGYTFLGRVYIPAKEPWHDPLVARYYFVHLTPEGAVHMSTYDGEYPNELFRPMSDLELLTLI